MSAATTNAKTSRSLRIAILEAAAAGLGIGLYLAALTGISPLVSVPLGLVISAVLWVPYALVLARGQKIPLRRALALDAPTLLAFVLLYITPFAVLIGGPAAGGFNHFGVLLFCVSLFCALKVLFRLRSSTSRPLESARRADLAVMVMMVIYVAIFSALSIARYNAHNMYSFDIGHMDQAIWNASKGNSLVFTSLYNNINRWSSHVEGLYWPLAALYKLVPHPALLLVVESIFAALGAWPMYRLAQMWFSGGRNERAALAFSLMYLLYAPVHMANLFDFHADLMAASLILWAFYFLEKRAVAGYWVAALLVAVSKEYTGLAVCSLGFYAVVKQRRYKLGAASFLIGGVCFVLAFAVIPGLVAEQDIGAYLDERPTSLAYNLDHLGLGGSLGEIARNALRDPVPLLRYMLRGSSVSVLIGLLLPLAFLPLLEPLMLVMGLPLLLPWMVSSVFSYGSHHPATVLPFLTIGAIGGAARLRRWLERAAEYPAGRLSGYVRKHNVVPAVVAFVVLSAIVAGVLYIPGPLVYPQSPLAWRFWAPRSWVYYNQPVQYRYTANDSHLDAVAGLVPDDAVVSATHVNPTLSHRDYLYPFPYPALAPLDVEPHIDMRRFEDVDVVLVSWLDVNVSGEGRTRSGDEWEVLRRLWQDDAYKVQVSRDGVLLLSRDLPAGQALAYTIEPLAEAPESAGSAGAIDFGERLRLLAVERDARDGRYLVHYSWEVLPGFNTPFQWSPYIEYTEVLSHHYLIADTLTTPQGDVRYLHWSFYLHQSMDALQPGDRFRETLEIVLPDGWEAPVAWQVGLYAAPERLPITVEAGGLVPGISAAVLDLDD